MNIFVLDENPITAAEMMCDKHIPKMIVESAQMMASAVRRWGATDEQMPIAKTSGKPYKGGYPHHPCTRWAGDTFGNFSWLHDHAIALCVEYTHRFGKVHACADPISQLWHVGTEYRGEVLWEDDDDYKRTPFALAMPDEYRPEYGILTPEQIDADDFNVYHASGDEAVQAYRRYYHSKQFAKWEKGTPAPDWWEGVIEQ